MYIMYLGDSMKKRSKIILLSFFSCCMVLSLLYMVYWHSENKIAKEIVEEERKYLIEDKKEKVYLNKGIFSDNPDTVGWLRVEGTNIDYPVVQYKDNDYYLNHDFKKNKNSAGWIFMDYKNDFDDQNIVFYGHHRRDGSMFGSIDLLFEPDFYKKHNSEIIFIKEKEIIKYRIFSVYKASYTDSYNSLNYKNINEEIKKIKLRSEIIFDEKVTNPDQIITLSTCHNNNSDRLVIQGIKI